MKTPRNVTNGTYTSSKIGLTRGSVSNILLISEGDVGIASPLLFLLTSDERMVMVVRKNGSPKCDEPHFQNLVVQQSVLVHENQTSHFLNGLACGGSNAVTGSTVHQGGIIKLFVSHGIEQSCK